MLRLTQRSSLSAAMLLVINSVRGQACEPRWSNDFAQGGPDGQVTCMAIYDDGQGAAL